MRLHLSLSKGFRAFVLYAVPVKKYRKGFATGLEPCGGKGLDPSQKGFMFSSIQA